MGLLPLNGLRMIKGILGFVLIYALFVIGIVCKVNKSMGWRIKK